MCAFDMQLIKGNLLTLY